jgi:hypothetical protein
VLSCAFFEGRVPWEIVSCDYYEIVGLVLFSTQYLERATDDELEKTYTGCPRRYVPDFGRVFLMVKYTNITQNTYVQS